jgi:ATP synthase F1 complex assembly factor 2
VHDSLRYSRQLKESGAEITLRRFWKTVHIKEEADGFQVTLDHRNLKTPAGTKLVLPKDRRLLALLIANEWENQDEILKQHALPLVSPDVALVWPC